MLRAPVLVRLYGLALRLLPPSVRQADGEEMVRTFGELWAAAAGLRSRAGVLARGFGRLPVVAVLEWRDQAQERRRSARTRRRKGASMEGAWKLVVYAARSLAKAPAFTWSAVLLLGVGVGSVTTIYTVVDHVLLRPLPYPAADRLVKMQNGSHSGPMLERFGEFGGVDMWGAVYTTDANLTGEGDPLQVMEAQVSRDFFTMFGARPAAGRLLVADDFRTGKGAVLSHGLWQRVWGGDRDVVGLSILIDGEPVVVVGVLDGSFRPPEALEGTADVWRPIDPMDERFRHENFYMLAVAGRLAPGATLAAVQQEADALAEHRAEENPQRYQRRDGSPEPLPVAPLHEATVRRYRVALNLLLGAVGLLLLVACVNVAHLFMARGVSRTREMSVRRALGARTRTLAGQLLAESVLIGAGGATLGGLLAFVGVPLLMAAVPASLPGGDAIAVDGPVLAFAVGISLVTAVMFGLLPALRLVGRNATENLQHWTRSGGDGRGSNRARHILVGAEVALSLVLVAQAGSLLRSFANLHRQELGFRTEGVWTIPLTPTGVRTPEEWVQRMDGIREALAATRGVTRATYALSLPLEHTGGNRCCWGSDVTFPGTGEEARPMIHPVDADYFPLLELGVVAGAPWERPARRAEPLPVVLSEPLALHVFGSATAAVGRPMNLGEAQFTVVGVVEDNRHYGPDQEHGPAIYVPPTAVPFALPIGHMAVQVQAVTEGLPGRLREAVWRAEPNLPVPTVRPLVAWAARATAVSRFESMLFATFGAVALLLVAGGLYGTLLYAVGRRRHELGIRLALGAAPGRVKRRVLVQGLAVAAAGAAIGVGGAWGAGRALQSRLFGVQGNDPLTLAGAAALVLAVALVSSWWPARRASDTDPMETLRAE